MRLLKLSGIALVVAIALLVVSAIGKPDEAQADGWWGHPGHGSVVCIQTGVVWVNSGHFWFDGWRWRPAMVPVTTCLRWAFVQAPQVPKPCLSVFYPAFMQQGCAPGQIPNPWPGY